MAIAQGSLERRGPHSLALGSSEPGKGTVSPADAS